MERVTITIEEDLLKELDALSEARGYGSRSELFRDMARATLAREALGQERQPESDQPCYGTLTYVYDHAVRDLPGRLTDNHHLHHALSIATTHVHVNLSNCLEVSILSGTAGELRRFADSVTSQRGVRYGSLHIIPVTPEPAHMPHHHHAHHGDHEH
jgi:CopG family nickel-responsive transcriptional regulator